MQHITLNSRIRVSPKHWLRAGELGTLVAFDEKRKENRYLIKLDEEYPGGGFTDDGHGQCLWLSERQFEVT